MTTTFFISSVALLPGVLHGAALGALVGAAALSRARHREWAVPEPWGVTAAWSLLGAGLALVVVVADGIC